MACPGLTELIGAPTAHAAPAPTTCPGLTELIGSTAPIDSVVGNLKKKGRKMAIKYEKKRHARRLAKEKEAAAKHKRRVDKVFGR